MAERDALAHNDKILEIVGACTCYEAPVDSRWRPIGIKNSRCSLHEYGAQIAQALAEAHAAGVAEGRETLAHAIFWLLRAYHSGHRIGWEPGPSTQETMDGLWTWLCAQGFDPNADGTPTYVPEILAALRAPEPA